MSYKLKNILHPLSSDVDKQTLLKYLLGKLTKEKQNKVQNKINVNSFEAEALEGLKEFKDKKVIPSIVINLNKELRKKTDTKYSAYKKQKLGLHPPLPLIITLILTLLMICYFALHYLLTHK
jgi:hypothetical protein